ncbi:hypothetical protein KI387_041976, partial [Taxus chinensis]
FLQLEAEFSAVNQEKLQHLYGDQVVQLKTNKLPQGLFTLEDIFSNDDQLRKEKTNISTHEDNYEEISVDDGKNLFLGK